MTRYAMRRSARAIFRSRRRRRRRRAIRWKRKPVARKALTLARRALRRTEAPERKITCLRNPFNVAVTGARAAGTVDGTTSVRDLQYWAISARHPYGFVDRYWSNPANSLHDEPISGLVYRWPPRPSLPNAYVSPDVTPGTTILTQSVPASDQHLHASGTYAVGHLNTNDWTAGADSSVTTSSAHGGEHLFHKFEFSGDIVYMTSSIAASATDGDRAAVLVKPLGQASLYTGAATAWLRIICVQQFKDSPTDRDLQYSDIYANPHECSDGTGSAPMNWLNIDKTPGNAPRLTSFRSVDDTRKDNLDGNSAPVLDRVNARGLRFAVLNEYQYRFSDTELESRRLRTLPVKLTVYPKRKKIWYSTNVGAQVSSAERGTCMNPVFVFFVSSRTININSVLPYNITSFLDVANYPLLWERMNVKAVWSTAP